MTNQATDETTGVVLQDWQGSMKLHAVPEWSNNISNDTAGNLVFTIEDNSSHAARYGAEARKHLPFRSYARETSMPKDTVPRPTYLGLGAGPEGGDGGSFWFFEDVSEQGGPDRWRWEQAGVGSRAIWTVWLLGAPSPVIDSLRKILEGYPSLPPPLPPFLRDGNSSVPWKDGFVATADVRDVPGIAVISPSSPQRHAPTAVTRRPLPPTPPSQASKPQSPPTRDGTAILSDITNGPNGVNGANGAGDANGADGVRLRPILPTKPPLIRNLSSTKDGISAQPFTPVGASPLIGSEDHPTATKKQPAAVDRNDDKLEQLDDVNASIGTIPQLSSLLEPKRPVSMDETEHPRQPAEEATSTRRALPRAPSEFRHSLVAVDPDTGTIVGVVAHNVHLSEDGGHAHDRNARVESSVSGSSSASATPQPSVLRATTTYVDEETRRAPSRPDSVLGTDTFAPPPIPLKTPGRSAAKPEDRMSLLPSSDVENFLSAKEYQTSTEEETASEADDDAAQAAIMAGFTSFDGRTHRAVESHRPDLLRDDGDDDDQGAASDASGSTIGGPAVKLWRKARGGKQGEKKRAAKKAAKALLSDAHQDSARRRGSLQVSEASVRTSRAETAREGDDEGGSDDEDEVQEEGEEETREEALAAKLASTRPESSATLASLEPAEIEQPASSTRLRNLHGHLPRAAMNTSQMIATEDALWREAFDEGSIPANGAYTHLAARRRLKQEEDEEPDLSLDPGARDAPEVKIVQSPRLKDKAAYLQGGTVLIEFLSGTSKITASIIKSVASDDGGESSAETLNSAEERRSVASGVLSLIPALPSHIFGFILGSKTDTSSVPASSPSLLSSWTSAASEAVSSPLASLFSWWSGDEAGKSMEQKSVAAAEDDDDDDEDDEWEVAIPAFDPDSLASTPRPVYRRKKPHPSAENGFNVRGNGKQGQDVNRYSIIHFDGDGVGRRAFIDRAIGLSGHPTSLGGVL